MKLPLDLARRSALPLAALLFAAACGSGGDAGWTFAPLGPTQSTSPTDASAPPTGGPTGSPAASPDGSPGESPGTGTTFDIVTPNADPLAFEPDVIEAPPATEITVNYLNDSTLPHNVRFFDGPDNTAPSLAATDVVTGPGALETATFTTPANPGDYYFWCDVHVQAMAGTLRITQ